MVGSSSSSVLDQSSGDVRLRSGESIMGYNGLLVIESGDSNSFNGNDRRTHQLLSNSISL